MFCVVWSVWCDVCHKVMSPLLQQNAEQLMGFVKDLRRANSALVEAFERCKKHHEAEKKRMKMECLQYVNRQSSTPGLLPITSS